MTYLKITFVLIFLLFNQNIYANMCKNIIAAAKITKKIVVNSSKLSLQVGAKVIKTTPMVVNAISNKAKQVSRAVVITNYAAQFSYGNLSKNIITEIQGKGLTPDQIIKSLKRRSDEIGINLLNFNMKGEKSSFDQGSQSDRAPLKPWIPGELLKNLSGYKDLKLSLLESAFRNSTGFVRFTNSWRIYTWYFNELFPFKITKNEILNQRLPENIDLFLRQDFAKKDLNARLQSDSDNHFGLTGIYKEELAIVSQRILLSFISKELIQLYTKDTVTWQDILKYVDYLRINHDINFAPMYMKNWRKAKEVNIDEMPIWMPAELYKANKDPEVLNYIHRILKQTNGHNIYGKMLLVNDKNFYLDHYELRNTKVEELINQYIDEVNNSLWSDQADKMNEYIEATNLSQEYQSRLKSNKLDLITAEEFLAMAKSNKLKHKEATPILFGISKNYSQGLNMDTYSYFRNISGLKHWSYVYDKYKMPTIFGTLKILMHILSIDPTIKIYFLIPENLTRKTLTDLDTMGLGIFSKGNNTLREWEFIESHPILSKRVTFIMGGYSSIKNLPHKDTVEQQGYISFEEVP